MKKTKSLILTGMLLAFTVTTGYALTGREVAEMMEAKKSPRTTHAAVKIEIIEDDGTVKERSTETFMAEDTKGISRNLIIFRAPASVKDTRFLTMEKEDGDSDQLIYLPALKKVRRIGASESGSSFMGTEFSYDDLSITSRDIDEDNYKLLREEKLDGYNCYVLEITPKAPKTYSRRIAWVIKDDDILLPIKMELYDMDGKLLKVLNMKNLEQINGYWTPMVMEMTNAQNGRGTKITNEKIEIDRELNPKIFSSRFLQTGKLK